MKKYLIVLTILAITVVFTPADVYASESIGKQLAELMK